MTVTPEPKRDRGRAPRRTADEQIENEFGYHPTGDRIGAVHDEIRSTLRDVAMRFNRLLPESPRKTEAIGHLRTAMWAANSAVACYHDQDSTWDPDPGQDTRLNPQHQLAVDHIGWALAIISNVSEGDWSKQAPDWQRAAKRWVSSVYAPNMDRLPLFEVVGTLDLDELAKRAYEAYGKVVGGVNVAGHQLPAFEDTGQTVSAGWRAAVQVGLVEGYQFRDRQAAAEKRDDRGEPTITPEAAATAVFEAIGEASTCWENMKGTGIFDDQRAAQIGLDLMDKLGIPVPSGYRPRPDTQTVPYASTTEQPVVGARPLHLEPNTLHVGEEIKLHAQGEWPGETPNIEPEPVYRERHHDEPTGDE